MNACIEDLNHAADSGYDIEENRMLQEISEIFYKAELVWSLCEIMYLENPIGVLPHLQEWIRIHFPYAVDVTSEVLASPDPGLHPNYWKALYGLIFQLRIDSATKLLKIHPSFQTEAFQNTYELLKKMPIFNVKDECPVFASHTEIFTVIFQVNVSVSAPEFIFRWNHWKEECESRIQAGDFFDSADLQLLVEVCCS